MKTRTGTATVGSIARAAGVSTASVSVALNHQPGVSEKTRRRILRLARRLGYAPDAQIGGWMARVRQAKSKDFLPIAWLNTSWQKDTYHAYAFQSPYLDGARERARELGYKIDEIWCHESGITMKSLTKILYQRGIEGVIVTHPARRLRLDWDHLASVALGSSLLAPRMHRVTGDFCFNLQLALKSLRRLGYRRIGICLGHEMDSYSNFTIRATAAILYRDAGPLDRVPPLFHAHFAFAKGEAVSDEMMRGGEVVRWLKRYRPAVVVGHDNRMEKWARAAGLRVPEDVGIVHLAVDDDVLDWAGIHSARKKTGATAVNQLVSLMRDHEYSIPDTPLTVLIRGTWQTGRTLQMPWKAVVRR